MAEASKNNPSYSDDEIERLQIIWGDGFLSPGGPGEVARMLGNQKIADCHVLDIGSGAGGIDMTLVQKHGAGSVVGIDVDPSLVDLANQRLRGSGLENRITFQLVEAGRLPFPDESFDVVFSKDSIVHVADKSGIYSEILRVMRPGARLFVSDWLRGDGIVSDETVRKFIEASGHEFTMISLGKIGDILRKLGYVDIQLENRHAWYLEEARSELVRMQGSLQSRLEEEIEFWEIMVAALAEKAIMPGHIYARKLGSPV